MIRQSPSPHRLCEIVCTQTGWDGFNISITPLPEDVYQQPSLRKRLGRALVAIGTIGAVMYLAHPYVTSTLRDSQELGSEVKAIVREEYDRMPYRFVSAQ